MRYQALAAAGIVVCASGLFGQQPTASPALDPGHNRLDAMLLRWEGQMRSVQTIVAQCARISVDKTFQKTEVFEGTAKYMKPNFAMLEMQERGNAQAFEKYICTGTYLYVYQPQNKVVQVYELNPHAGQVADDNFLSFLFGMKAEEARRRYDLRLVKDDQWWIYIEITPRFPADKADFQKARLVLSSQTFLPRELWFEQPNGNEVKWDIPKIESGVAINRTEFTEPQLPQGWRLVRVPRTNELQPRVVRPSR